MGWRRSLHPMCRITSPPPSMPAASRTQPASGCIQRSDGPVYIVTGRSGIRAVRADDLTDAEIKSAPLALKIAEAAARQRGQDISKPAFVDFENYDQWTVPNGFDRHRPLYRIALNDDAGREFYVSSVTGEVVLDTTRRERAWNYVGSVTHWIYPTMLRKNHGAWDATVWWLSLVALIAAISGNHTRHPQGEDRASGASSHPMWAGRNGIMCLGSYA